MSDLKSSAIGVIGIFAGFVFLMQELNLPYAEYGMTALGIGLGLVLIVMGLSLIVGGSDE